MEQQLPQIQISRFCKATPEAVYDLLADLRTHIEWGGARQSREFRLVSFESPPGLATVGTSFSSTGTIPMLVGTGQIGRVSRSPIGRRSSSSQLRRWPARTIP
jgi:hypothetical protein